MNIDYSQFYRGTANLPSYGGGAYKKDTLVKYEFNTKDEQGNKVMDQMSKEETLQAMKDIRSQYGDAVIVEFSGDGMAAFVNSKKGSTIPEDPEAMEANESLKMFRNNHPNFLASVINKELTAKYWEF